MFSYLERSTEGRLYYYYDEAWSTGVHSFGWVGGILFRDIGLVTRVTASVLKAFGLGL